MGLDVHPPQAPRVGAEAVAADVGGEREARLAGVLAHAGVVASVRVGEGGGVAEVLERAVDFVVEAGVVERA